MYVLVIINRGVVEGVRLRATEDEAKAVYPTISTWQDFGYKQGAHLTEYITVELFRATP